jgi:hypothetical protein
MACASGRDLVRLDVVGLDLALGSDEAGLGALASFQRMATLNIARS